MIVIELEEKQYGKSMEAVSMIKLAAHCLEEMFEEHSIGKGAIDYRGGSMGYRGKDKDYEYEKYNREYPEYERILHRGDYGRRFM